MKDKMVVDLHEVLAWVRQEKEKLLTTTIIDDDIYAEYQKAINHLKVIEATILDRITSLQKSANTEQTTTSYISSFADNKFFNYLKEL